MIAHVRLVWELARKDLRLFLTDRRGAILCFAVPILLASAFGAIFQRPAGPDTVRLPLLVVDEDDSPLSRRVVAALCASDKLDATASDRTAALRRLDEDGSGVVLILPPGFGRVADLRRESCPKVELLHHPGSVLEGRWAEGLFTEVVLREVAGEVLAPLLRAGAAPRLERPFEVERRAYAAGGPAVIDSYGHSFCGMTLQYLLFWGMDSGLLLLRERRQGIWRRLRAAPVSMAALLGGKALATAIIALLQIAVTFGFGRLAFGVGVNGSVVGFLGLALAAAVLSAATGLLVAALGGSEGRARSIAILAILALSMLGGFWVPSCVLPPWVRTLALALPTTWAVRGFEGVTWQGMGCAAALRCAAVLLAFSGAFLVAALWGFARSEFRLAGEGVKA
jgi:ABC-2 type transport system permease protein